MADHTVVNLIADVENMAPKYGMEGIEARFARTNLELEQSGLSSFVVEAGMQMPFGHRHTKQEEIYVVLDGRLEVKIEDEIVDLGPMDAVRIAPGAGRSFRAGPDGAHLLAFGAPNTDNKDAEMVDGFWDR